MTTQKSKSPESIAQDIVNICGVPIGNDRDNLIYSISQAIKAERENIQHTYKQQNIRMRNNRLVLPPRRVIGTGTDIDVYNGGFNACLELIEKGEIE